MDRAAQGGASLLEVLVTIMIVSLGLLGLGGLQATGLRNNYGSYLRAQAAEYAFDMADRVRANMAHATNYAIKVDKAPEDLAGDQLHNKDLREWLEQLAATLPSGDGSVQIDGDRLTVVVEWDDRRAKAIKDAEDEEDQDETLDNDNTNARFEVVTRL